MDKREQESLVKLVGLLLTMNKYTRLPYEAEKRIYAQIFYQANHGFAGSTEEAEREYDERIENVASILRGLPAEILEEVGDLRKLGIGIMSPRTRELLEEYYRQKTE